MSRLQIHQDVEEMISVCPSAAAVLMELGIDPSRHAHEPLAQVCRGAGIDPTLTLEIVTCEQLPAPDPNGRDWSKAPLAELVDHVIESYHQYLTQKLPLIRLLLAKAEHDDAGHPERNRILGDYIRQLDADLRQYLEREQNCLLPLIREMAWARGKPRGVNGKVDRTIEDVTLGYQDIARVMAGIRQTTDHFHAPDDACTAYQSLLEQLSALDLHLQRQQHLEVDVLFPRAQALERELGW